jgi:hypothetical protein
MSRFHGAGREESIKPHWRGENKDQFEGTSGGNGSPIKPKNGEIDQSHP